MKLVVSRDLLTRALARIQGVLNRKATSPVVANALLEATVEGGLRLAATDLDVTYDGRVAARVEAAGRTTVDGKRLFEIARSLPGEEVALSVDEEHRLVLRCKASEFVLHGLSADGYPVLPSAKGSELHAVDGLALRALIERTAFSVSVDESRPNLNGVFLVCGPNGRGKMVSTDGHRLSQGERDLTRGPAMAPRDGVIIPRKGIGEVKKLLDDVGAEVDLGFLDNNLVLRAGELLLFVRLIDAAFPDYTQVIPKSTERKVVLDRASFLAALKRISILASERTHGVRIELTKGAMTLTSDNPDLGKAREELETEGFDGAPLSIAFNSRYLVDILSTLTGEKIAVALNEALSPGLFREHGNDDYLFVVMPMRL